MLLRTGNFWAGEVILQLPGTSGVRAVSKGKRLRKGGTADNTGRKEICVTHNAKFTLVEMVVSINQILNPFLFGTARSLKYYLSDVIDGYVNFDRWKF